MKVATIFSACFCSIRFFRFLVAFLGQTFSCLNLSCQEKPALSNRKPPPRPPVVPSNTIVNTDAAWRSTNQTAGLGWVIKARGVSSSEYTSPARHVSSALTAEGLAVREALVKCKDLGISHLRCEADSAQLIKAINTKEIPPEIYGIVSDICSLAECFDEISFSWISREKNSAADKLAKLCLVEEEAIMANT